MYVCINIYIVVESVKPTWFPGSLPDLEELIEAPNEFTNWVISEHLLIGELPDYFGGKIERKLNDLILAGMYVCMYICMYVCTYICM